MSQNHNKWSDHTDVQCQNGQTAMRKLLINMPKIPGL